MKTSNNKLLQGEVIIKNQLIASGLFLSDITSHQLRIAFISKHFKSRLKTPKHNEVASYIKSLDYSQYKKICLRYTASIFYDHLGKIKSYPLALNHTQHECPQCGTPVQNLNVCHTCNQVLVIGADNLPLPSSINELPDLR